MCSSVFANDLEQVSAGWEAKGEINYRIHLNASKSLYWKHSKWDEQKFLLIFLLKLCLFFLLHLLTEYFKPEIYCFERRYYISLMDAAQNLIFITSYYIYFKLLMILFFNLMMLIERGILLKNHVTCNLSYNITSQFHSDNLLKTLYQFYYLSWAQGNLETCIQVDLKVDKN